MKTPVLCAALCAVLAAPAAAETRYDRKLEEAVMEIVAGKMGAIRGQFAYDSAPVLIARPDPVRTASTGAAAAPAPVADREPRGLSRARERRISPVVAEF